MAANPPPVIGNLVPTTFAADAGYVDMSVIGSGFANGCVLSIGGQTIGTAFVADTQVTASFDVGALPLDTDGIYDVIVRNPDSQVSNPVSLMITAPVSSEWACTPQDVANLLRSRTKDKDGTEVGMWTADTRPTLTEVEGIIALALGELSTAIGAAVPDACAAGATSTSALLAAMLVELSYFPEQVRSDRSAYTEYRALYDKQLDLLRSCVEAGGGGAEAGGVGVGFHNVPVVPAVFAGRLGLAPPELALWSMRGPWGDLPFDHWPEPENPANWRQPFQPPREPPLPEDLPVGDAPASGEVLT